MALIAPRVSPVVVSVALPEAKLIVVEDLQALDPFGRRPQVQVRPQQPRRPAVIGLQRLVAPSEIAAAASFFASPAAASVTGQELVIDGAQTLNALSVTRGGVTAGGH